MAHLMSPPNIIIVGVVRHVIINHLIVVINYCPCIDNPLVDTYSINIIPDSNKIHCCYSTNTLLIISIITTVDILLLM